MKTIIDGFTDKEIAFMEYWTGVLKHKANVSMAQLEHASNLIGFTRTGNCSGCMRNDAATLNNMYRQLLPSWNLYLDTMETLRQVEASRSIVEIKQEPIKLVEEKKVEVKKPVAKKKPIAKKKPVVKKK